MIFTANVSGQLILSTFADGFSKDVSQWWVESTFDAYPFYMGSWANRGEDGVSDGERGKESLTITTETSSMTKYISIAGNGEYGEEDAYCYLYSIQLVPKKNTKQ